jgi:hypothetical protein
MKKAIRRKSGSNQGGRIMLELIAAGAVGIFGHLKSKDFVKRRLRFTKVVEMPAVGLIAGGAAAVVAAPVVALLPVVGVGTALLFGAGVGTGVHVGARMARDGSIYDD